MGKKGITLTEFQALGSSEKGGEMEGGGKDYDALTWKTLEKGGTGCQFLYECSRHNRGPCPVHLNASFVNSRCASISQRVRAIPQGLTSAKAAMMMTFWRSIKPLTCLGAIRERTIRSDGHQTPLTHLYYHVCCPDGFDSVQVVKFFRGVSVMLRM